MIEKELLLKPRLAEEDYDIAGVGPVRLRSLSWEECSEFQQLTGEGLAGEVYAKALAAALVDPAITVEEAATLLGNAPGGEVEALVNHIFKLSGLEAAT